MTTWLGMYEQNMRQMYDDIERMEYPEEYEQKEAIRAELNYKRKKEKEERWEKIKSFFKKIGGKNRK